MIVLILGKTRMREGICIGGYLVEQKRSVRLIPQGRHNNPLDDKHEIGDLWDIEFHRPAEIIAPHTEDIIVTKSTFVRRVPNLNSYIAENISPYRGSLEGLYNGLIRFTSNGSGYISHDVGVTNYSTCFWQTNKRLYKDNEYYRYYTSQYGSSYTKWVRFKFVGLQEQENVIESGTLVRLSLARWWAPHNADIEERCYVQLSGWF